MITSRWLPTALALRPSRSISNISLVDLSMSQITGAKSQADLVDKLVQVDALHTPTIIQAFAATDRLRFLDPAFTQPQTEDGAPAFRYAEPYENVPQKLSGGAGSTMSTPHHHAIVAEQFRNQLISGETDRVNVLDVGTGSGYLAAVFAGIVRPGGGQVVGMECVPELVDLARTNCAEEENVSIVDAFGANNDWNLAPIEALQHVHVIHLGFGATTTVVDMFLDFLAPGGALLVPIPSDNQPNTQQLMQSSMLEPIGEQETSQERLARVQQALSEWRQEFASRNGREPTRQDMFDDETASDRFSLFTKLRKRTW